MNYWLMKSEPEVFSIEDLRTKKSSLWDGVRNYQARNFMTQAMEIGDLILFYHSNAQPSGVAGVARVVGLAEPDPTQFDKKSDYYDAKATQDKPRWFAVKVGYIQTFSHFVSLETLRARQQLSDLMVLRKGQRLSIQPVSKKHFELIVQIGEQGA
jgi:predicted RNA-binding protein with PUA-like domain